MAQSALLTIMTAAARKAARSLKRDFGEVENLQVSRKGPADFVSAADQRAEEVIFEELHKSRPTYSFLMEERAAGKAIFPPASLWFNALDSTPLDKVKAVILGQDPYHGPGQAHGLAFSVPEGVKVPPSLVNIYKELESDLGIARRDSGNLENWARQGVLLLNNTLTVASGQAGSHAGRGWDAITDACVASVVERGDPAVFILWGSHARKKAGRVTGLGASDNHLVLTSPHPSPLSAHSGFFGSRPFSKANNFLKAHGCGAIDW